jgi:hypothetical protein
LADEPRFLWRDETRFKNLGATTLHEAAVLGSFSVSVARPAVAATPAGPLLPISVSPASLRAELLKGAATIGLDELLALCWAFSTPVIYLRLFPLAHKRMHAVTANIGGRHAILIGQESRYAARIAYFIAHELGHIALGHVGDSVALLDVDDPLQAGDQRDEEEEAADRFALELLTGSAEPEIESSVDNFNARQLADAAITASVGAQVDPGVLALCLAHRTGHWQQAVGALKLIPPGERDLPSGINALAAHEMRWSSINRDAAAFLTTVMDVDA